MIDNLTPFLDQLFWQYLCFSKQFWSLFVLRMLWWQYGQWPHLSEIRFASCSLSFKLISWNSCNCSTEWLEVPLWYSNLLFGLYHLRNYGCMEFNELEATSLESSRHLGKLEWQRYVNLLQRHLSSWCLSDTCQDHITMVSIFRVIS